MNYFSIENLVNQAHGLVDLVHGSRLTRSTGFIKQRPLVIGSAASIKRVKGYFIDLIYAVGYMMNGIGRLQPVAMAPFELTGVRWPGRSRALDAKLDGANQSGGNGHLSYPGLRRQNRSLYTCAQNVQITCIATI
jgi:hypothetical protein